jgi:hypothetical protein
MIDANSYAAIVLDLPRFTVRRHRLPWSALGVRGRRLVRDRPDRGGRRGRLAVSSSWS